MLSRAKLLGRPLQKVTRSTLHQLLAEGPSSATSEQLIGRQFWSESLDRLTVSPRTTSGSSMASLSRAAGLERNVVHSPLLLLWRQRCLTPGLLAAFRSSAVSARMESRYQERSYARGSAAFCRPFCTAIPGPKSCSSESLVTCQASEAPSGVETASQEDGGLPAGLAAGAIFEAAGPQPHFHYPTLPYLASSPPLDPVIKIFTVTSSPNYFQPWQNKPQREVTGSGFAIAGQRILTNAHVVANQTFVLVRKHGSSTKYRAEVQAVGHECDLALLTVQDSAFWEGVEPLSFGDIPKLQDAVAVVGYPQGGDNISLTGGVVSRVELMQYAHGAGHLLAVQIDAAINPGNSGGPALMDMGGSRGGKSDWKVAGVAFQNLAGADNIGYIIPVPVIQHFLADVEERGRYVGFCSLGLQCQAMENAQLRAALGMAPTTTGVLVNKVHKLTDSAHLVKKDDVLLAFDGVPIANDGSVHFRQRERISFDHLVAMKKAGEKGRLRVLRAGKEEEFDVELHPLKALVPVHQFDRLPSYFIFAGLVFVPLTQPYLHEYGEDWYNTSPRRLCEVAMRTYPDFHGQQVVILSQVLLDDVNAGYQSLADLQVKKVNGVEVKHLRHLRKLVEGCSQSQLRFDLDDDRVVVLEYAAAKAASLHILRRHRIPSPISEDLEQPDSGGETEVNPSLDASIDLPAPEPTRLGSQPDIESRTLTNGACLNRNMLRF